MNKKIQKKMDKMSELRLPELQARFAEIVGEPTRSPNKKFLLRRIGEVLEARAEEAKAKAEESVSEEAASPRRRGRFADMTIEELQAMYLDVVGRPTRSDNRAYLQWKIREAEKGRIPVGPRKQRKSDGEFADVKILPLRLETEAVERMDEAWRARGMRSRMEFFRRALGHYLKHIGAGEAAGMFEGAGESGA